MRSAFKKTLYVAIACFAAATQLGNGCTSDGNSDRDDDYYDRPNRPDYDRPNRPDDGGDRDIPRRARVVVQGRGDILKYRASEDGQIWLSDADRGRVIDSRGLQRGEEYIISTKDDKVWIDRDRKLDYDFDRDTVYRIHFLALSDEGGRRDDNRRDTRPPPNDPPREESGPIFGGGAGVTIPKSASIVREARGEDLSFTADGAGTVFVYDVEGKTTLATWKLKNGQRFTVSPATGQASVDGKPVFKKSLSARKTYRLYFDLSV